MRASQIAFIAAAVAVAASAPAARAQSASAPVVRPIATYSVRNTSDLVGMPTRLTISDSAGKLVGSYWMRGERTARPLDVGTDHGDIILSAYTRGGPVQFLLKAQDDQPRGGRIS